MLATGAIGQAVTAAEFKAQRNILPEDTESDAVFDALLVAAQAVVETAARRPMLERPVQFQVRAAGWRRWWFPVAPVTAVTALHWQDATGAWVDLGLTGAVLEMGFDEPQLVLTDAILATVTDGAALRIAATVGHAAGTMPAQLKQAVILTAWEWHEAGMSSLDEAFRVGGSAPPALSFGAHRLIRQVRYARPVETAAA